MQDAAPVLVLSLALSCATAVAQPVRMAQNTPYADDAEVSQKVRSECVKLGGQLPAYTREFGAESGVDIERVARWIRPRRAACCRSRSSMR